jgi:hypothetical protein
MDNPETKKNQLTLELGDIIQIISPTNDTLHEKIFLINYIDENQIQLINDIDYNVITLDLINGILTEKTITSINILVKQPEKGYARQNNLLVNTWIDIHFGGDTPTIITGKITNLEEDNIEIEIYPNKEVIYIDFGYKGIPLDIPIESINIREKPLILRKETANQETVNQDTKNIETADNLEDENLFPHLEIKKVIQDVLQEGDEVIEFLEEELDAISQEVQVSESEKRYDIEQQKNDLLNDLLSTIPTTKRTETVLNDIQNIITRFTQLRKQVSIFDENNIIIDTFKKSASYKPLVEKLYNLNTKLYWILPVVKSLKVFDKNNDITEDEDSGSNDIIYNKNFIISLNTVMDNFYNNQIPVGENPYDYLLNKLDSVYDIYKKPKEQATFEEKLVNTDLDVIINNFIHNSSEFYSSVKKVEETSDSTFIKSDIQKYVISRYNLGFNKLKMDIIRNRIVDVNRVNATKNDNISIDSLIMLPKPYLKFTHVSLPNTNIYDKTNLNHASFGYWNLLKKNLSITNKNVDDKNVDDKEFLSNIHNYVLDSSISDDDKYRKFLESIIPTTKKLFNIVKNDITYNTSYNDIIKYLEPFMIYNDDITFSTYKLINGFIEENIIKLNKKLAESSIEVNRLSMLKNDVEFSSKIILNALDIHSKNITDLYQIINTNITSSELLQNIMDIDNGSYYFSLLSKLSSGLLSNINVEEQLDEVIDLMSDSDKIINKNKKTCKNLKLTKYYNNYQDLTNDNNNSIYYSSMYDPTNYDILDEYKMQRENMDEEQFNEFMRELLIDEIGLKDDILEDELEALMIGSKPIKENDYAILVEDDNTNTFKLFKRENNIWVFDDKLTEQLKNIPISELNGYFCNRLEDSEDSEDIINPDIKSTKQNILREEYDKIKSKYDEVYNISSTKIKSLIDNQLEYNKNKLVELIKYRYNNRIKNNNIAYNIGVDYINSNDGVIITSPYVSIRDRILGIQNLDDKYNYLLKFINNYTRDPFKEEDNYWYYCIDTDTKLLPTFYYSIAKAYLYENNYNDTLDYICKLQGKISDDGDSWVDIHSGYVIMKINFVDEETYDESGFKTSNVAEMTDDIIITDIDDSVETNIDTTKLDLDKEGKLVNLIINSLITGCGINPKNINEFIIKNVLMYKNKVIVDEGSYQLLIDKNEKLGKTIDSYKKYSNKLLLFLTAIIFLVAIQTHIPTLKISKPMAGCVASISGFPCENNDDFSGIEYISCVMKKIANDEYPWVTIKKTKSSKIRDNLVNLYNKVISNIDDVKIRIKNREDYLSKIGSSDFVIEDKYSKWTTFLPPLQPIKTSKVNNITSTFKDDLQNNISSGSKKQVEQLLVIKSKIMKFSLEIQKSIENIIQKEDLLLKSKNGIPFIQNFCCNNDTNIKSLDYFVLKDKNISNYNSIVDNLNKLHNTVNNYSKSAILFSDEDTKLKYPNVNNIFNETTIYQAFIEFCKFNKSIPINEKLRPLCLDNKSEFNITDTIEDKIEIMKSEGKNYNNESLLQLLNIVNRENIIHIKLNNVISGSKKVFEDVISYFKDKEESPIDKEFISIVDNLNDTYSILKEVQSKEVQDLQGFLLNNNSNLRKQIKNFIKSNIKLPKNKFKNIEYFIDNFDNFDNINSSSVITSQEETSLYVINYIKNCINDMVNVLPYIIINNVYKREIKIPADWNLSSKHINDFRDLISKYYSNFKFLKNFNISHFNKIKYELQDLNKLVNNTPFISSFNDEGSYKESIYNANIIKELYVYYFLNIIQQYINITNTIDETINYQGIVDSSSMDYNTIISNLLVGYFNIFITYKNKINYNREKILSQILKIKEYEKGTKTDRLKALTDEQRKADGELRKAGLGVWGVALQKGLTQYDPSTYDAETTELKPFELDKNNDNYMSYDEYEAYNMSNIPEDDDIGEGDNYVYQGDF